MILYRFRKNIWLKCKKYKVKKDFSLGIEENRSIKVIENMYEGQGQ